MAQPAPRLLEQLRHLVPQRWLLLLLVLCLALRPVSAAETADGAATAGGEEGKTQGEEARGEEQHQHQPAGGEEHGKTQGEEARGEERGGSEEEDEERFERRERTRCRPMMHETETEAVNQTMAMMLFGFLALGMMLPYFTNYNDADIRMFVFQMISTTITIFCAVLLTQAIFAVFVKLLSQVHFSRAAPGSENAKDGELNAPAELVLGVAVFLLLKVLLSVLCWYKRGHLRQMCAVKWLLGHLSAFAGIRAFGGLLHTIEDPNYGKIILYLLGAVVFQAGCLGLGAMIRKKVVEAAAESSGESVEEAEGYDEGLWTEIADEAEDESMVLICSYLVNQLIVFIICGEVPNFQPEKKSMVERDPALKGSGMWLVIFLALLVLFTCVRPSRTCRALDCEWMMRVMTIFQDFLATSSSWCALRMGCSFWIDLMNNDTLAYVVNAFVMSFVSVVVMILIDTLADKKTAEAPVHRQHSNSSNCSSSSEEEEATSEQRVQPGYHQPGYHLHRMIKHVNDPRYQEKALRTVISALGILIALSWELAFDVAEETLAEAIPGHEQHPMVITVMIAVLLGAVALPSWMRFILPMAMLPREHHQGLIDAAALAKDTIAAAHGPQPKSARYRQRH